MLTRLIIFLFLIFLVLCIQALAFSPWDYIDDRCEFWGEYAQDQGYDVIASETSGITILLTFTYILEPGKYHVYAQGDRRIIDLGLFVYGENGEEIANQPVTYKGFIPVFVEGEDGLELVDSSRSYPDPSIEFSIQNRQEVEFEFEVFQYDGDYDNGYLCFVLAMERPEVFDAATREHEYGGDIQYPDAKTKLLYKRRHYRQYSEKHWEEWYERDTIYLNRWREYWDNWDGNQEDSGEWFDRDDAYRSYEGWHAQEWREWEGTYNKFSRERWSRVESLLDGFYQKAYGLRLIPIVDHMSVVTSIDELKITLPYGRFIVFAAAGPNVADLKITVCDEFGFTLGEGDQSITSEGIWLDSWSNREVMIEVEAFMLDEFIEMDYYCLLLCMQ